MTMLNDVENVEQAVCSETYQGEAYGHNEELICVENREYDVSKLDDELSSGSVVMEGPHKESQMDSSSLRESEEMILFSSETVSRPVDEMAIQTFVEPSTMDRQCAAYIEAKGRQCVRMAIQNNIYCCAHFSRKKDKRVKVVTRICGATTVAGTKCKCHSLPGFYFCKKHWHKAEMGQTSNSIFPTLNRKAEENCSGSQSLFCKDLVLVPPESPLEIDPVSVIQPHVNGKTSIVELEESQCLEAADIWFSGTLVNWHQDEFICPRGCNEQNLQPVSPLASLSDDHLINSRHIRFGSSQKALVLCDDISFAAESTPVICVVDQQILNSLFEQEQYVKPGMPWEMFTYVTKPMFDRSPSLDYEGLQLECYCESSTCCSETCEHAYHFNDDYDNEKDIFGEPMHGRFAYDVNGRIILEEGYIVFECNDKCRCDKTCPNRILQNGIRVKLEVFKTEKKGWGVRAGEAILRGTFVCEYIGKVLEEQEAHNKRGRHGKENCSYFFDIDARINHMSRLVEGQARYVIDSTEYGNVSRFINNSCSPNLVDYKVLVESTDCKRAHIGLYASRDIALGEELTYNYHYELVDGEGSPCLCGSSKCRGRLY